MYGTCIYHGIIALDILFIMPRENGNICGFQFICERTFGSVRACDIVTCLLADKGKRGHTYPAYPYEEYFFCIAEAIYLMQAHGKISSEIARKRCFFRIC